MKKISMLKSNLLADFSNADPRYLGSNVPQHSTTKHFLHSKIGSLDLSRRNNATYF